MTGFKMIAARNTTATQFLAKGMILGGEMSLSEIAERVGYENDNDFSRSFKVLFGITPMRMKKSRD